MIEVNPPNPSPAASPYPNLPLGVSPGSATHELRTIAGTATATPTQARALGRSPSTTATITGSTAATAAAVGATAAALPLLSPANKDTRPNAPAIPAAAPSRRS